MPLIHASSTSRGVYCGRAKSLALPQCIAGTHKEFDTAMDYMAAKALGPLVGDITPRALVQKVDIPVVDLRVSAEAPRWAWEEAIEKATVGHIRVYTDGCKDSDGVVGRAWWRSSSRFGARWLGMGATV